MTDKNPGIVLIIEMENDERFLKRLINIAEKYRIKVWVIYINFEIRELDLDYY